MNIRQYPGIDPGIPGLGQPNPEIPGLEKGRDRIPESLVVSQCNKN